VIINKLLKVKNTIKKEYLYDMKKRVVIYARVSTLDKGQNPENQLVPLREYCQLRKFELVGEFVDYASGKNEKRPQYKEMLEWVNKRKMDIVLVWRYDRFARSTVALVNALKQFQNLGIDFISFQENIDTTSPQGELIFSIMASLAQFEATLISQRVKAGMARAKAKGKLISRPQLSRYKQQQIKELYIQGLSINKIHKQLGIAYGTAWNYIKRLKQTE